MLGFPKPIDPDDERLEGHETDYRASRGGWYPVEEKPVPGTPQQDD
jgi:hypothetical protein